MIAYLEGRTPLDEHLYGDEFEGIEIYFIHIIKVKNGGTL